MPITSEQLTPLQRRLVPSLTDVLFAVLAVGQFHRGMFADGDSGWHLWAGFDALAHGPRAIPDTLSFTRAGVPWRNLEWLADAIIALCYRNAGYFGVTVLMSLVFAVVCTWLYRILLRETGHVPASLLAMGLAGFVLLLQLMARPLVFSFLLVLAAWELVRVAGRERLALWLLPPLTVLWANLHPTAFLAPALAGFGWLTRGRDRRLALAALLSLAALGATPWGYGWVRDIAPTGANLELLGRIDEWQTPRFSDSRFAFVLAYLLVAVGVRRWGPRLAWGEALMGMACLAGSLFAARLGPIAAILWAPYLARDLACWSRERGGWILGRSWRAVQGSLAPFERVFRPGHSGRRSSARSASPWLRDSRAASPTGRAASGRIRSRTGPWRWPTVSSSARACSIDTAGAASSPGPAAGATGSSSMAAPASSATARWPTTSRPSSCARAGRTRSRARGRTGCCSSRSRRSWSLPR